jgi:hypothetical protein
MENNGWDFSFMGLMGFFRRVCSSEDRGTACDHGRMGSPGFAALNMEVRPWSA